MIKRVSLGEQVMEEVLKLLRNGEYKNGDKLPSEAEISSALGVGRNSVREAMKALAVGGIIESTPGKGTFLTAKAAEILMDEDIILKAIQSVSIKELMEVRKILEVEAAGLAATRALDEELIDFEKKWNDLKEALKNKKSTVNPGWQFHQELVKLSGNILLKNMMESIFEELKSVRAFLYDNQEQYWQQYWNQEHKEHKAIYDAIMNRNPEEAKKCVREHLEIVEKELERQMKY